jgi:hypothetical protein
MPATTTHPRVVIELTAGADPIRGSLEHADGSRRPFWGWLELIDELRRIASLDPHPAGSHPTPRRKTRHIRRRP